MDSEAVHDQRTDFGEVEFGDRISCSGEAFAETGNSVEILTRLELDLACASEKIVNLNVLLMHVATRENEFETLALKRDQASDDSLERALEFDFLSGVLDSEVRDLDGLMAGLQTEVVNARELVSSCSHEEGIFKEMAEKLRDSEQSFEQSQDQISGIRTQSETLQSALSRFNRENNWNINKNTDDDQFFNMNPTVKMATAKQQRHILRMLEKSLAREIDLDKKLADSRQVEDSSDKVESLERQLRESELQLQCAIASAEASQEKQNLLYTSIEDMQNLIDSFKMKVVRYETQADSTEDKCKVLSESNAELNDEVIFLQGRLESLEASLQQANELKISAAKDIGSHTKVVNKLVLQLAFERNRLQKQISSLAMENKRLIHKLKENSIDQSIFSKHGTTEKSEDLVLPNHGSSSVTCSGELREEVAEWSPISSKIKTCESIHYVETKVTNIPGPDTVRRIDTGVLSYKHILLAILILLISVGAYYYFHLETCPF